MSIASRPDEPAVRRFDARPTDREFPYRRRTRAGSYALMIAGAVAIGLALLAFGSVRMSQSTAVLQQSGVAASDNLVPDGNEGVLDRNSAPPAAAGEAPSTALPDGTAGLGNVGTTP